ncbi:MAG: FIG00453617: hypothetical protein [uncultured Paraburkholderia sp.]|nr:MAG: FIG00453617: hypothetical protein [uncultured Paraburkholderia sp.]CAH2801073.1 MAG: FIG00453617: hypothetical protein [uncultured Paraburkholderia sp.]CAH2935336.1 MAG: FIG00453617: hypothetical protein [uncultured Paraburkholderia sp.]CAH2938683.1 MAG: FIG00453617: hypothetical protein [uncultured Paraburkholderia sp.]
MQFDYRHFHIDCRARHADEGVYYARARITRMPQKNEHFQSHDSGDIDAFSNEADAISCARLWAIEWCDEAASQMSNEASSR